MQEETHINWCYSTNFLTISPHLISYLLSLPLSRMRHVLTYIIPMIFRLLLLALLCFKILSYPHLKILSYPHQFEIGTD